MDTATKGSGVQETDSADDQKELESNIEKNGIGGWTSALLLLVNQGLATLAYFGVGVNLVLFLTRVLGQSNATAANNVSIWTGTVYLCSLVGAFLSDSYWGRFRTCLIFQAIFITGLMIVSLSSWLLLLKPKGCGNGKASCRSPTIVGTAIFYLAIYLVALGYGGHQPTLATFGADQFDNLTLHGQKSKSLFFSYFYFALNAGSLFSNTVLVFYEDNGKWCLGYWAAMASAIVAMLAFLLGCSGYRYIKPHGNPIPRVAQVFVAAARKCNVKGDTLYEVEELESSTKGIQKIDHTNGFRCLDKAAVIEEDCADLPWRLCTVTQVEEVKCIIRLIPIWLCTIMYSVIFTQMASLFVEQGDVMDSQIGKFKLPAASMSAFDICSVLVFTGIYRQVLIPIAVRLTGNPKGLTELQRMGMGLIVGMLAMIAAGVMEVERLKRVVPGKHGSSMKIFWQIPQYVLVGASEVLMYVGQLEFFNGQAPDGIKSLGSSMCMASMSLGNFVSSSLVKIVMAVTAKGGNPGWIPGDLNRGNMDRFFFLIAAMTAFDFFIYILFARGYKPVALSR